MRRARLAVDADITALRLVHGAADGLPGLFADKFGPGCTLIRHLGIAPRSPSPSELAGVLFGAARDLGVQAVYDKPFIRDRSTNARKDDPVLHDPQPVAGDPLPPAITIQEPAGRFEIHLYDGFSTGLFLDQRENRTHLHRWCVDRPGARVVNLFSYTGAFSVACARAGAELSTVDVSPRYLDWAKRNFTLNDLDAADHHFARMDAREFLRMAARKGMRFDLIILDPPTFGSADKKRKVPAWSSVRDYPELLQLARAVLHADGQIFVGTNTAALCEPGVLDRLIDDALGPDVPRQPLAPRQVDFPIGDVYLTCRFITP